MAIDMETLALANLVSALGTHFMAVQHGHESDALRQAYMEAVAVLQALPDRAESG